jgi:hypothetical protein
LHFGVPDILEFIVRLARNRLVVTVGYLPSPQKQHPHSQSPLGFVPVKMPSVTCDGPTEFLPLGDDNLEVFARNNHRPVARPVEASAQIDDIARERSRSGKCRGSAAPSGNGR